jgi:hypothetical protein
MQEKEEQDITTISTSKLHDMKEKLKPLPFLISSQSVPPARDTYL